MREALALVAALTRRRGATYRAYAGDAQDFAKIASAAAP